jgi:hypothetical protein
MFAVVGRSADADRVAGLHLEIRSVSASGASLHWKITNTSDQIVYIYDVFLFGPAFKVQKRSDGVVFDTAPVETVASCPPNRFLPPLLIPIWPGRSMEGDFQDPAIKSLVRGQRISLRIAAGPEPDSISREWQEYLKSDCRHSPYDAIVRWATVIESEPNAAAR